MLERPLFANKAIHFIRSFILERNHVNVICVAIDILESHDLQFITEFIWERTLINVMYVAVALLEKDNLEFIGEFILK